MSELYIGIMSGTSVDSIDAALLDFSASKPTLIDTFSKPFDNSIRREILSLFESGNNEIDRLGSLSQRLGALYSQVVKQLLKQVGLPSEQIKAIGCHGQTIRHRPNIQSPFSLQLGDSATLAQSTNIPVISQFRQADIAAGGQGAPLAPAFHHAVFHSQTESRCIINIGGISNITLLPKMGGVAGWDTGPGNGLMDAWIHQHQSKRFDHNGDWARTGELVPELLDKLLTHTYFKKPPPKSTGKEEFTLGWLEQLTLTGLKAKDIQRTLLELTAQSINNDIKSIEFQPSAVYICGGGAFNGFLLERLEKCLVHVPLKTTEALGLHPDWVEAGAFAWLAHQFWHRVPTNTSSMTGAKRNQILGQLTLP